MSAREHVQNNSSQRGLRHAQCTLALNDTLTRRGVHRTPPPIQRKRPLTLLLYNSQLLHMDYSTETLPQVVMDTLEVKGNFATKNARFREAACQHLHLRFRPVDGQGNCFFAAVAELLQTNVPYFRMNTINADEIRARVVDYLSQCPNSTQDVCERCTVEMEAELEIELSASGRGKLHVEPLHGETART